MSKSYNDDNYACPVFASTGKCGEQDALRVMEQFKDFYEGKLSEIDVQGGGDCLELKLKIQRRWIDDLTEQTQMMAKIVKELEDEATSRVRMLEDKLRQTSKSAYENKEKEAELKKKLEDAGKTIDKLKSKGDVTTKSTGTEDVSGAKQKEQELEDEIGKRQREVDDLKCKCAQLEETLRNTQGRAENLQKADSKAASRNEVKKLRQQNRYYAHVIDCFKNEMSVMSEQLVHLQEILNLSNVSCREESCQLYSALTELQNLSDKLKHQLIDTEKRCLIENQKNQLKDAKIDELQLIIGQKNADLNVHDVAINEMKVKLENTLIENHELRATIDSLNSTVVQQQCFLKNREIEKPKKKSRSCVTKRSLSDCRDYKRVDQYEIEKYREKCKEKVKSLKRQNEELKEKLATTELSNGRLMDQLSLAKEQMASREQELTQNKQVVIEMRQTLIELNESLASSELHHMALVEEFQRSKSKVSREQEDLYMSCQCEIALYKKLAESFKKGLLEAKKNLAEIEGRSKILGEEVKQKEVKIADLQKKLGKKEKENSHHLQELKDKLKESQAEEKRLSEFIETLRAEVQKKLEEKKVPETPPPPPPPPPPQKKVIIQCYDCENMSATQEEINSLKIEIKSMIKNQLALNHENDKLLKQVTCLQNSLSTIEEKNRHLKQKLEKLHSENQSLKEKNKILTRENEAYTQTIRNLEMELADAKNCRDDLCVESRQVVSNVKAWLEEQRKINEKIQKRTKCYCDTITQLREENENLVLGRPLANSTCKPRYERVYRSCIPECPNNERVYRSPAPVECPNNERVYRPPAPVECPNNVWCLGSQGSGSIDSPRDQDSVVSCTCSMEEWYSPNYRDEETEEEFVNTLEATTLEIRNCNRKYQTRCECNRVTRDTK